MKAGRHLLVQSSLETRVDRILKEYAVNADTDKEIINALDILRRHISGENIDRYIKLVEEGNHSKVAEELIIKYYDPLYLREQKDYEFDLIVNADDLEKASSEIIAWLTGAKR